MSWLVLTGLKPYDGRYELADQEFTTLEWGWIKRLAGYLPMTLNDDAFGDPELICALAVIALHRAGRVQRAEVPAVYERLAQLPFGDAITAEDDEEPVEGDAGPPVRSSNGNEPVSGGSSPTSSESSTEVIPPASGTPGSGSSPSAPVMSPT